MEKQAFLDALDAALAGLPQRERDERLSFYSELIDDRVEEGTPEEEVVASLGDVCEIARESRSEYDLGSRERRERKKKRALRGWEIALLVLGSPLWISLGAAALAVVIALYAALWSVMISLWAVDLSLAVCGACGPLFPVVFAAQGNPLAGVALLGCCLSCGGSPCFCLPLASD